MGAAEPRPSLPLRQLPVRKKPVNSQGQPGSQMPGPAVSAGSVAGLGSRDFPESERRLAAWKLANHTK